MGLALCSRSTRGAAFFVSAFFVFSFAATASGGLFSPHHFILLLPAVALAVGSGISFFARPGRRVAAQGVFGLACLYSLLVQRHYLFGMTPVEVSRATYGLVNPFPEAIEVGRYIASHAGKEARIAVLGSESEIYFYSRRRSASGFLFMYSLTEPSRYAASLQGEMFGEVESSRPEYVVYAINMSSWFWMPDASAPGAVFYWAENYLRDNFDLVGVADIRGSGTEYFWGDAVKNRPSHPIAGLEVYRRKPPAP
jgi:hypothetical protein